MVRTQRFFAGIALFSALTFSSYCVPAKTLAADEKKEEKKLELPKLPEGSSPKWDFSVVEERFTIIKGGINGTTDNGTVYFLVELKENMVNTPQFTVNLIDKDGIKLNSTVATCKPGEGKKGERVRLNFEGLDFRSMKLIWMKTAKVEFVAK